MSDAENTTPAVDESAGREDANKQDDSGLKSALEKERERAKNAERDLRKLQARIDELDNRDKTDVERLTKERDTLAETLKEREAALKERTGRAVVMEAARDANAVSGRALWALIRDELEYDDDGEPTNVDKLIAGAKRDEPSMFRATAGSGDGGKGGGQAVDVGRGQDRLAHAYANPRR